MRVFEIGPERVNAGQVLHRRMGQVMGPNLGADRYAIIMHQV